MDRKHSLLYLTSSITLLLALACVTAPAVPTQQSVSTTDPNAFSTMVAQAAGNLMTQTAEVASLLPSPVPTESLATETPIPTATETPVTSISGTSLLQLEDGSTQFIDNVAGVRLTIPPGWVTVRLNEPEYLQVWSLTVEDPVLQHGLEGIQNLDPAMFRLHAFNTKPDYVYAGKGSQINVVFTRDDVRTLEQVAEEEKQPQAFTDYALISAEFQVRPDSLELFIIEEQWRGTSSPSEPVMIYYKGVLFKVPSGTVAVELFVPLDIKHEVVPVFDQMVEQLTVFTP
ncbi:MAG: hypothetical protein JW963_24300 [Anaerolineales bacterium]|nr:hypothetical protein [Anaerolineales bacterium]